MFTTSEVFLPNFWNMQSLDIEGIFEKPITEDDRRILGIEKLFVGDDSLQSRQHLRVKLG